jgi:hypothetical protein
MLTPKGEGAAARPENKNFARRGGGSTKQVNPPSTGHVRAAKNRHMAQRYVSPDLAVHGLSACQADSEDGHRPRLTPAE